MTEKRMCHCSFCRYRREVASEAEKLRPEQRDFWISLYEKLLCAEFELDMHSCWHTEEPPEEGVYLASYEIDVTAGQRTFVYIFLYTGGEWIMSLNGIQLPPDARVKGWRKFPEPLPAS